VELRELKDKLFGDSVLAESDQFVIKFAETEEEVEKALRLRYEVFNLERGHQGIGSDGIDTDEFDRYCLHMVLFDKEADKAIGTYRMHFGTVAKNHDLGLYSAREFQLDGMDRIIDDSIEMGRSCVSPEYRDGSGVALMWGAIATVLKRSGCRYLFGCVSIDKTEPALGWALYEYLREKNCISPVLSGQPTPEYQLDEPDREMIRCYLQNKALLKKEMPPLLKGYLRLGAKICSTPVIDRDFGTIDFLIIMDFKELPERYMRHFVEK